MKFTLTVTSNIDGCMVAIYHSSCSYCTVCTVDGVNVVCFVVSTPLIWNSLTDLLRFLALNRFIVIKHEPTRTVSASNFLVISGTV